MPLASFYPKRGHVLICDFDRGFVAPEMVKRRPVVVISRAETHRRRLCTVVPFSTTTPHPVQPWHVLIQEAPLPGALIHAQIWAKCDMLYTVSFERLNKLHRKTRQGREYLSPRLNTTDLQAIMEGVRAYLGL